MNLRPPQAAQHLGIGLTKFWDLAKNDPDFPTLTKLGARTTIVSMEALDQYVQHKARAGMVAAVQRKPSASALEAA